MTQTKTWQQSVVQPGYTDANFFLLHMLVAFSITSFSEPAIALFTPGICKTRTLDWTARGLDHGL